MKAYILKEGERYTLTGPSHWEFVDMPVEDAIKKYSGVRSLFITWTEEGETPSLLSSTVILSYEDNRNIANMITDQIFDRIKDKFTW